MDSILGNNLNDTLHVGSRGSKKLKQEIHRNFIILIFFRKYSNLYVKAHQKTAELLKLGSRLAHPLSPTSCILSVGCSYSRQALSKVVEQISLWKQFQCLTTLLAMSFHLVPTEFILLPLVIVSSLCFIFSAASLQVGRLQWDFPLPPLIFYFQSLQTQFPYLILIPCMLGPSDSLTGETPVCH